MARHTIEANTTSLYLQMLSGESQPAAYPLGIVLVVLSGLAIILDLPPLIWHIAKRNVALATLIIWLLLLNLMNVVNALIWPNDNLPSRWTGVGLCDVEVKLQIGSYVGLPGALAVIMRTLVGVLDTNSVNIVPSSGQRKRNAAFMLIFCFGLPVYVMAVHYIVQPNRYAVWAISGCTPTTDGSWLALFLLYIWPVIVSVLDVYYAIFLVVRMQRYRAEFSRLLENSNTTKSRFLRLFIISIILVVIIFPLQVYILYRNVGRGLKKFKWSKTHSDEWQLILPVPTHGYVLFDRWIRVGSGFLVFAFFGVGRDATRMYKGWLRRMGLELLLSRSDTSNSSTSTASWRTWFGLNSKARRTPSGTHPKCDFSRSNNSSGSYALSSLDKDILYSGADTETTLSISDMGTFSGSFIHETKEFWSDRGEV